MKIPVDIQIDFLWGEQHFKKDDWGPITYIVGANGTGKSIFAEKLKQQLGQNGLKVRYFGADRIANLAGKWDASLGEGGLGIPESFSSSPKAPSLRELASRSDD